MAREPQPYMQNRELSWLTFNERVLEEARDPSNPLAERLKFVSIFTSNLDEFFMIRVGSLYDMAVMGDDQVDSRTGLLPSQQLEAIYRRAVLLMEQRDQLVARMEEMQASLDLLNQKIDRYEQSMVSAERKLRLLHTEQTEP